jgi:hypothetical protein
LGESNSPCENGSSILLTKIYQTRRIVLQILSARRDNVCERDAKIATNRASGISLSAKSLIVSRKLSDGRQPSGNRSGGRMMTIVAVKPAEIASDAINNVSKFTPPLTWLTFLKRHQRRANWARRHATCRFQKIFVTDLVATRQLDRAIAITPNTAQTHVAKPYMACETEIASGVRGG